MYGCIPPYCSWLCNVCVYIRYVSIDQYQTDKEIEAHYECCLTTTLESILRLDVTTAAHVSSAEVSIARTVKHRCTSVCPGYERDSLRREENARKEQLCMRK